MYRTWAVGKKKTEKEIGGFKPMASVTPT